MSEAILLPLLKANAVAGALILMVIVMRPPLRRAFGARITYASWLLPLVGAVASILPAPEMSDLTSTVASGTAPSDYAGFFTSTDIADNSNILSPIATIVTTIDMWDLGLLLWLVGCAGAFAWLAILQLLFQRDMRKGRAGPAVIGFARPRLIVPGDFEVVYTTNEREVILAHENTHIARQDARVVAIAELIRCLNWFNPLVHIAVALLRVDQELACDAQVIACTSTTRRLYAETMLKTQLSGRALPLGCRWPARGDHPLAERIRVLAAPSPGRVRLALGAAALAVVCSSATFAAWAVQPPCAPIEFADRLQRQLGSLDEQLLAAPQRKADAELAVRYAMSRGLPLTDNMADVGTMLRSARDAGLLDAQLRPTGAQVTVLPDRRLRVGDTERSGELLNFSIQKASAKLTPMPIGIVQFANADWLEPGTLLETEARFSAPDGKAIVSKRQQYWALGNSKTWYEDNGSSWGMKVAVSGAPQDANVVVTLFHDKQPFAERAATIPIGRSSDIAIDGGLTVKVTPMLRQNVQDLNAPQVERDAAAYVSHIALEVAQLRAAQLRGQALRTAKPESNTASANADRTAQLARVATERAIAAANQRAGPS